jgi:HEAT repeat protein
MGPILLGVYGGDAPEVHEGFVPVYESQLQAGDESDVRRAVAALAQLRSERAADVLIGLLDRTQGRVLQDVVVALAYQASPRAAAALRAFAARNTDPEVAKTLGIALLRFR